MQAERRGMFHDDMQASECFARGIGFRIPKRLEGVSDVDLIDIRYRYFSEFGQHVKLDGREP